MCFHPFPRKKYDMNFAVRLNFITHPTEHHALGLYILNMLVKLNSFSKGGRRQSLTTCFFISHFSGIVFRVEKSKTERNDGAEKCFSVFSCKS